MFRKSPFMVYPVRAVSNQSISQHKAEGIGQWRPLADQARRRRRDQLAIAKGRILSILFWASQEAPRVHEGYTMLHSIQGPVLKLTTSVASARLRYLSQVILDVHHLQCWHSTRVFAAR
jgi:hypothetical protein